MNDFWHQINSPFYALAPMEDVTDTVFREIVLRISDPDIPLVLFSEFTSVDGMLHPVGKQIVSQRLFVSESERKLLKDRNIKIVAQIWGSDPEKFFKASQILKNEYFFDGVDINMGCPVKKIVSQGACSALIQQPKLAAEIIAAVKEGSGMPVSVKTRIGFKSIETEAWISSLLNTEPSAITVHGRTQKMQSEGLADWNEIGKAVKIRNELKSKTKILGNGDVISLSDANDRINSFNVDGVMIGRGIFANPWLFTQNSVEKSMDEKIEILKMHCELYVSTWRKNKNFSILKRFFKIYLSGFPGASALRASMMLSNNLDEVSALLKNHKLLESEVA